MNGTQTSDPRPEHRQMIKESEKMEREKSDREEYPPRSQWTEQEKETCGPQTIMEMRWVACTPEQYKLVFQNIAHSNGFKEVLSVQYDSLLYLFAEWVTDLATRRMDQYNVRIGERNRERIKFKEQIAELQAETKRLRAALEKIASAKGYTRLADCCVDKTCHINEESGSCSFQTGVHYANCDRAAEAEEALLPASGESEPGNKGVGDV